MANVKLAIGKLLFFKREICQPRQIPKRRRAAYIPPPLCADQDASIYFIYRQSEYKHRLTAQSNACPVSISRPQLCGCAEVPPRKIKLQRIKKEIKKKNNKSPRREKQRNKPRVQTQKYPAVHCTFSAACAAYASRVHSRCIFNRLNRSLSSGIVFA